MIKCVVWDLDNTLWDGVLDEDDHVVLKHNIDDILKKLIECGIVNAISSKNDKELVKTKLEQLGLLSEFTIIKASWGEKVVDLRNISKELNVGLDSILFIDDSDFELAQVKFFLPEVTTLHAKDYKKVYELNELKSGGTTKEGRLRAQIYNILFKRKSAEQSFVGTREQFLRECNIKITIRQAQEEDLSRVSELMQRTNQFNATYDRWDIDTTSGYFDKQNHEIYVCELKDKYGDYGIVGSALLNYTGSIPCIDVFTVSCKIEGRGVGKAMLSYLLNNILKRGYIGLCAKFHVNARNRELKMLYDDLDFRSQGTSAENNIISLYHELKSPIPYDGYIEINDYGENNLKGRIRGILSIILGSEALMHIKDEDDLYEGYKLDSITSVNLITGLEREFDFEVDFDELSLENFKSINIIAKFVEHKLKLSTSISG